MQPPSDRVWQYPLINPQVNYGLGPMSVPEGAFVAISGMDGRYQGSARRFQGHQIEDRTTGNIETSDQARPDGLESGLSYDVRWFREFLPFSVVKRESDLEDTQESLQGFLGRCNENGNVFIWWYDTGNDAWKQDFIRDNNGWTNTGGDDTETGPTTQWGNETDFFRTLNLDENEAKGMYMTTWGSIIYLAFTERVGPPDGEGDPLFKFYKSSCWAVFRKNRYEKSVDGMSTNRMWRWVAQPLGPIYFEGANARVGDPTAWGTQQGRLVCKYGVGESPFDWIVDDSDPANVVYDGEEPFLDGQEETNAAGVNRKNGRFLIRTSYFDDFRQRRTRWSNPIEAYVTFWQRDKIEHVSGFSRNDPVPAGSFQHRISVDVCTDFRANTTRAIDIIKNGFNQVEIFGTTNTEDLDLAAGGLYYRMFRIPRRDLEDEIYNNNNPQDANRLISAALFADQTLIQKTEGELIEAPTDTTKDYDKIRVSNSTLVTLRQVDTVLDEPDPPPDTCIGIYDYQNVTVLATVDGSRVKLRWSPAHRIEKEIFPEINEFDTEISSDSEVMFIEAGDFLWFFGDGPYYRIRRNPAGYMEVIKAGNDLPIVSRYAGVAARQMMYIATYKGIYQVDGSTGQNVRIAALDRLLRDRWANQWQFTMLAYDSVMDAVVILNRDREETENRQMTDPAGFVEEGMYQQGFEVKGGVGEAVVLWRSTGRVGMLSDMGFASVHTLQLNGQVRAVFLTTNVEQRSGTSRPEISVDGNGFETMKWSRGLVTMRPTKETLAFRFTTSPTVVKELTNCGLGGLETYNTTVITGRIPSLNTAGGGLEYFEATLDVPAVKEGDGPFLNPSGWAVRFLDGRAAGYVGYVATMEPDTSNSNKLKITGRLTCNDFTIKGADLTGAQVSISPIPFEIVGGCAGGSRGPNHMQRKRIRNISAVVRNLSGETKAPNSSVGVFRGGVANYADIIARRRTNDLELINGWFRATDERLNEMHPGVDVSTIDKSEFSVYVPWQDMDVFPVFQCLQSNLDFEVYEIRAVGDVSMAEIDSSTSQSG